ncbi:hypothetical protein DMB38_24345 [Streptomyces sp. WAC 06738]|nr:hypothetical protein DMB38_24345 [Streptomyces sp. WAC 06738]
MPARATGRVISWMGKGVVIPTASRASAVSGRIPRSRNVDRMLASSVGRGERRGTGVVPRGRRGTTSTVTRALKPREFPPAVCVRRDRPHGLR